MRGFEKGRGVRVKGLKGVKRADGGLVKRLRWLMGAEEGWEELHGA